MARAATILLVGVLMLAACEFEEDSQGEVEAEEPAPEEGADEDENEDVERHLVVGGTDDEFVTEGDDADLGIFPINANIFETLIRLTPDFQLEPGLAQDWEQLDDTTWRFELRNGVTFHDGQPLDAEAVQSSFERMARAHGDSLSIDEESAEVVDDLTVELTTTEPNPGLPNQLVHPSRSAIVAPDTEVGTEPTGTGPFQFVEYKPEEELVVESYDDYWDGSPGLDGITFRFIPDDTTRWLSLESGEVDLIYDLPRELVPDAQAAPGIELGYEPGVTPTGAVDVMLLNHLSDPPNDTLGEEAVRRAVAHAVDRDTIIDQVWTDAAMRNDTFTPPSLLGEHADRIDGIPFDPGRAEELLEDAGWSMGSDGVRERDGERLELTLVNGSPPIDIRKPMPEFVQAQLGEVGMDVEIVETPEFGDYWDRIESGEVDIMLARPSQNDADPLAFATTFLHSESPFAYGDRFAAGEEFNELVDEAQGLADRDEAIAQTAEALRIAIEDEVTIVPIASVHWLFAMSDEVEGFVPHGSARNIRWDTISMQ